jgi:mersacidin/lichenicidin family type 2 lantibiotic
MSNEEKRRGWNEKVIRAWKDEEYRATLTVEERALIPENPAGLGELSDAELEQLAGGCVMTCGISAKNTV